MSGQREAVWELSVLPNTSVANDADQDSNLDCLMKGVANLRVDGRGPIMTSFFLNLRFKDPYIVAFLIVRFTTVWFKLDTLLS